MWNDLNLLWKINDVSCHNKFQNRKRAKAEWPGPYFLIENSPSYSYCKLNNKEQNQALKKIFCILAF